MDKPIDKGVIKSVSLYGEACPTCGNTANLHAYPNIEKNTYLREAASLPLNLTAFPHGAGNTFLHHKQCRYTKDLDVTWDAYVEKHIRDGWIRFGVGDTLIDPRALKPGMESSIYRDPAERGKSGCFVATAVYGHPDAPEVLRLREFRDRVLLSHRIGRGIVHFYYRVSPSIAKFLSANRIARRIARALLDRVVRGLR